MPAETIIRSRHNPIYKQIRSLLRRDRRHEDRAFLVEGPRFIADAVKLGGRPSSVVLSETYADSIELPARLAQFTNVFDDELFSSISDTVASQGVIGVFPFPDLWPDPRASSFVLVADGVQDPGNLGTLIRSAAGAGATQVIVLPGTVDPWSPKTVRAAAGMHFVVPISMMTLDQLEDSLTSETLVVGADAGAAGFYDQLEMSGPLVLIVGSEGHGLSQGTRKLVSVFVSVPLAAEVESLNAGVAGSILLFEGARQRRNQP